MCRLATAEFDPVPGSVPLARRFVDALLGQWQLPAVRDIALLLVTELMTNGVVHASTELSLVVAVLDGTLEIGVTDCAGPPTSIPFPNLQGDDVEGTRELLSEGGRGLVLVDSLADEWGVAAFGPGKHVWFRLRTSDWSFHSACPCQNTDLDRVRLESGRYTVAVAGPWDTPRRGT